MFDKAKMEKLIFMIIIASGIGYAYYTYVFCGQIAHLQEQEKELENKTAKVSELRDVKKDIVRSREKLANLESELLRTNQQIPDAGRLSRFNMELYYYIKSHNLKVSNLEAKTRDISPKTYGKQPIEMSVTGKKQDIIDLFSYLRKAPIKIKITECAANIMDTEGMAVSIKLNTFFMLEKGEKK